MSDVQSRLRACIVFVTAAVAFPAFADAPINAVPPAAYRGPAAVKSAAPRMALPPAAPAKRIDLAEPTATERDALKAHNAPALARNGKPLKRSLAIAMPRDVPSGVRSLALSALPWQALADGGRAARVEVASPGAAAMRVALELPPVGEGVTLLFAGNGTRASTFGPVPSGTVASDTARFGMFWSPVLEGDVATIELRVESGVRVPDATLTVARISHQVVAPVSLQKLDAKAVSDIGTSGSCEIDVACVTPQSAAFAQSGKAVAQMEFTKEDGFTYLCTGTLLNDSLATNTPYFFSASHCLDSAMAARTLNTFWFFDAVECGSRTVPPYVQQAAGASMLARSPDWDWALVRLDAAPPAGAHFSAWRAEPIPTFATVSVFHHPQADLKKWSQGTTHGYQLYTDGTSFALVQYDQGVTEPGSSGAGLLTFFGGGGYYELRGGLWSGRASCAFQSGQDEYSRIDSMLPLTREYLTPSFPGTPGQAVAVEFYNRALDHYFVTISREEIDGLDRGVHPGWVRTGLRFLAYDVPAAGTSPVCRFYRTPGFGDSHFYSASVSECNAVIENPQKFPGWTHESASVFYIALPDPITGACAAGTRPIWRFYNQRTVNHRYTAEQAVRDEMRDDPVTWAGEGYGPDRVIMCAPVGT